MPNQPFVMEAWARTQASDGKLDGSTETVLSGRSASSWRRCEDCRVHRTGMTADLTPAEAKTKEDEGWPGTGDGRVGS